MADTATTGTAAAAQTNEPLIRVEGLRKSFGSLEVLKGIDLSVNPGEVVTIIGASCARLARTTTSSFMPTC